MAIHRGSSKKCRFCGRLLVNSTDTNVPRAIMFFFFIITVTISSGIGLLRHGTVRHVCLTPMLVALPSYEAERHNTRTENNSTKERCNVETRNWGSRPMCCWRWQRRRHVYSYVTTYNHHMHVAMEKQQWSTTQISQITVEHFSAKYLESIHKVWGHYSNKV